MDGRVWEGPVTEMGTWKLLRGQVLAKVEADAVDVDDRDRARAVIAGCVREWQDRAHADDEVTPLGDAGAMVDRLVEAVCDLGPLTPLLADRPDNPVEEVLIRGDQLSYVTCDGRLHRSTAPTSEEELASYVDRLLQQSPVSVSPSAAQPHVSVGLPGRLRVSVMVPPVVDRLDVAIRRMVLRRPTLAGLVDTGMLPPPAASLLWTLMQTQSRVVVAGDPGAGKTTLLDAMLAAVPARRVVRVCERARELSTPLAAGGYAAATNRPGQTLRDVVCWQLRFRPWLLVVGEVLGGEAFDALRPLNAGCGFACTVHANQASDVVDALVRAATFAGEGVADAALRRAWAGHVDVVVFCDVDEVDGRLCRQVVEVVCVTVQPDGRVHNIPIFVRPQIGKPMLWTCEALPDRLAGRLSRVLDEDVPLQAVLDGRRVVGGVA